MELETTSSLFSYFFTTEQRSKVKLNCVTCQIIYNPFGELKTHPSVYDV